MQRKPKMLLHAVPSTESSERPVRSTGTLLDRNGGLIRSGCTSRWHEYFSDLLNYPPPTHPGPPSIRPTRKLHNDVAPTTVVSTTYLQRSLSKFLTSSRRGWSRFTGECGRRNTDWRTTILLPFFKEGDTRNCSDYRGIRLIDVVAKNFKALLLKWFRAPRDQCARTSQSRFREGCGYLDQILGE